MYLRWIALKKDVRKSGMTVIQNVLVQCQLWRQRGMMIKGKPLKSEWPAPNVACTIYSSVMLGKLLSLSELHFPLLRQE